MDLSTSLEFHWSNNYMRSTVQNFEIANIQLSNFRQSQELPSCDCAKIEMGSGKSKIVHLIPVTDP